ncbi:hypothetical protein ABHQ57_03905 [Tenacibaculum sp. ZH5_bin.1]|uniref:hypothetical protein n=1 Tax=Tenacibaculum TaxID=104267 RepID=UPI0014309A07|nr:hypothetical protein [Tenacibaculum mesophilum]KAF9659594.1 hypothetical protein HBA12_04950 [Tenacibaculum mesophilum]
MKKVKVYDAIMGSGKTYNAIQRMKHYLETGQKFIYITPFLKEVKRIKEALSEYSVSIPLDKEESKEWEVELNMIDNEGAIDLNAQEKFRKLNKRAQFLKFVLNGDNVVSTHSLFKKLSREDYTLFDDYILILDEVIDPLELKYIGEDDIDMLRENNQIVIDHKSEVRFINENYKGRFQDIKKLCNSTTVFYLDKCFFAWIFPKEIFNAFKEIQILTYLFKGSLLCAYFKLNNIEFDIKDENSIIDLLEIKSRLNIYDGIANEDMSSKITFSVTFCKDLSSKEAKKISNKTSRIFRKNFKTGSKENCFTTFKDYKKKLSGDSYTRGFVAVNARATNEYSHKKSMAYLANRYFTPQQVSFFRERNIELNQDLWALGELVQWIWRGCIRNKEEMNLYIPSYRMRNLLYKWLDGEFLETSLTYNECA